MSDLIKQVDFQNINMTACKTNENKIFVGIKSVCEGLGIDHSSQMKRINRDEVLSTCVVKMTIEVSGQNREVSFMEIEALPLFLTGITSSMCREEIRPRLKEFKLKAKDVLAAAFVNKQPQCVEDLIIMQAQSLKDMRLQLQETKQETTAVKQEVQAMKDVITIKPSEEWRKKTNVLINRICMKTKDYKNTKEEIYKALQERAGCDLKTRLKNMRGRLLLNGATQSKVDSMNYLDVIAEDKKLIEIYTAIVKELAVKNSIQVKEVQYGKG